MEYLSQMYWFQNLDQKKSESQQTSKHKSSGILTIKQTQDSTQGGQQSQRQSKDVCAHIPFAKLSSNNLFGYDGLPKNGYFLQRHLNFSFYNWKDIINGINIFFSLCLSDTLVFGLFFLVAQEYLQLSIFRGSILNFLCDDSLLLQGLHQTHMASATSQFCTSV